MRVVYSHYLLTTFKYLLAQKNKRFWRILKNLKEITRNQQLWRKHIDRKQILIEYFENGMILKKKTFFLEEGNIIFSFLWNICFLECQMFKVALTTHLFNVALTRVPSRTACLSRAVWICLDLSRSVWTATGWAWLFWEQRQAEPSSSENSDRLSLVVLRTATGWA